MTLAIDASKDNFPALRSMALFLRGSEAGKGKEEEKEWVDFEALGDAEKWELINIYNIVYYR